MDRGGKVVGYGFIIGGNQTAQQNKWTGKVMDRGENVVVHGVMEKTSD